VILKPGGNKMKCKICNSIMNKGTINHVLDFDNHIIIIKNVPAIVCEQCGEYFLEHKIALRIESLVDTVNKNHAEIFVVNYDEMVA